MPQIYSDTKQKIPKYNVSQIINKFMISLNKKIEKRIKVYYAWSTKQSNLYKESSFITIDFDRNNREWYINYIENPHKINVGTVNDITGQVSISKTF